MNKHRHYAGLDAELAGHLAEDTGLTTSEVVEEPGEDFAEDTSAHLATDANLTKEEFEEATGPSGQLPVNIATFGVD